LVSRKAHVYKSFPGLRASLAQLPHDVVLDGEIVCRRRRLPTVQREFPATMLGRRLS